MTRALFLKVYKKFLCISYIQFQVVSIAPVHFFQCFYLLNPQELTSANVNIFTDNVRYSHLYIQNNKGESTHPCGTPVLVVSGSAILLLNLTNWDILVRKCSTHVIMINQLSSPGAWTLLMVQSCWKQSCNQWIKPSRNYQKPQDVLVWSADREKQQLIKKKQSTDLCFICNLKRFLGNAHLITTYNVFKHFHNDQCKGH